MNDMPILSTSTIVTEYAPEAVTSDRTTMPRRTLRQEGPSIEVDAVRALKV